jgi:hypothetical protein
MTKANVAGYVLRVTRVSSEPETRNPQYATSTSSFALSAFSYYFHYSSTPLLLMQLSMIFI